MASLLKIPSYTAKKVMTKPVRAEEFSCGIIFFAVSWMSIVALTAFCFMKIFSKKVVK